MTLPPWLRRCAALPALPAAALLSGLVFLFEPAQIYQGNHQFFSFSSRQIGLPLLGGFAASLALLLVVTSVGGARWRHWTAAVLTGLAVAAWAGAAFLTPTKGLIDGQALLALTAEEKTWRDAGFAAIALAAAAAALLQPLVVRRFVALLFVLLAAQAAWIVASDAKASAKAEDMGEVLALSKEKNVVVLLLDTFQADFFPEIVETEPSLREALRGFTFFPNAVAHAPTTYLSMPTIHAGALVTDGANLEDLYRETVVEGSFMAKLSDAGYDSVLVNPAVSKCPKGTRCMDQDALLFGAREAQVGAARSLLRLALYRVVPASFKGDFLGRDGGAHWSVLASHQLFALMPQHVAATAPKPVARFFHLYNTHPPAVVDAQCGSVQVPWSRQAALEQARCAMRTLEGLLDAIRSEGVYDQTAIFIIADHGAGLPPDPRGAWSGPDDWGSRASPLFLAKPFGAKGPLATSSRVVGLRDVAATVCAQTGDCTTGSGADVFGAEAPVAYQFTLYRWKHEYWFEKSIPLENRFEIRGPPLRLASWWRLTNLPENPVPQILFGTHDAAASFGWGWSYPENGQNGHRWALGEASDLYLPLDPARDAVITLETGTHPWNTAQAVVVEVGGTKVADFPVPPRKLVRQRVTIPAKLLSPGATRMLFRYAQWNAPPRDSRPLSVYFRKLRVGEGAEEAPAPEEADPGVPPESRYAATLPEGIDFSKEGYPDFIASVEGMSHREPWGRWTVGSVVRFRFTGPLPRRFTLGLTSTAAFGPNDGAVHKVRVGDWTGEIVGRSGLATVELPVETGVPADAIEITIAKPTSPVSLKFNADMRELGLAFARLTVTPR